MKQEEEIDIPVAQDSASSGDDEKLLARLLGRRPRKTGARVKAKDAPPSRDEFLAYARSKEISTLDGSQLFEQWSAADWVDGNGKPIVSWKRTLLAWKHSGYLPSDRRSRYQGSAQSKPKGIRRV